MNEHIFHLVNGQIYFIKVLDLTSHRISALAYSENLFSPRWSPDGQHILAMTENSKKLVLYDLSSRKWSEWIDEPGLSPTQRGRGTRVMSTSIGFNQ
jgi:hypothetical protein